MSELNPPTKPRVMAVANQKGGVGKTTTAINLAAALVEAGKRVLILDLDPQGNASTGLGIEQDQRQITTYDVLVGEASLFETLQPTDIKGLWLAPADESLAAADAELLSSDNRSFRLKAALEDPDFLDFAFDYVIIDCPPSLNLLTVNAMVAASSVLVPLQSEFFALEGLSQLMVTIRGVRNSANPGLRIEGIVLTMYDGRNRLSKQVLADARDNLGELVFETIVPRNVRLSEAPSFAMPILEYDTRSKGSKAYRDLAQEIVVRHQVATR